MAAGVVAMLRRTIVLAALVLGTSTCGSSGASSATQAPIVGYWTWNDGVMQIKAVGLHRTCVIKELVDDIVLVAEADLRRATARALEDTPKARTPTHALDLALENLNLAAEGQHISLKLRLVLTAGREDAQHYAHQ